MKVSASNPIVNGKLPHLKLKKGDITPIVLLPGDPSRVEYFKDLCDDYKIISKNREYVVGVGKYKGVPITVCSTGIGAASTEIAVIELIQLGAKVLIRIGGTGSIKENINPGEMIITTGSMRRGGSSIFYAPLEYPAVASYNIVSALVDACKDKNINSHTGIGASVGSYYAGQGREAFGKKLYDEDLIEQYQNMNVINLEMETETILTLANIFGIDAGSICVVHGNRVTDEWIEDFKPYQMKMLEIALDTVVKLGKVYL